MSNSFEQYAEAHTRTHKPRVLTSEAQAPMKPTPAEKEQRDTARQFARYRRGMAADHKALRIEFGTDYQALLVLLKSLSLGSLTSANGLVRHIRQADWIKRCTDHQRAVLLSIINAKITRLRQMNGRPPIDDAIFGEPKNLFLVIREEMTGV